MPYADRFQLLADALPRIRSLCRGVGVDAAHLEPWSDSHGGPPILIGSWHSGLWVRRAALEYDGWLASGFFTTFAQLREGIQRYRSFGGRRALVSTIRVNLRAETSAFDEDSAFSLECSPSEAKDRLSRLADLGYDDALLSRANHSEADITEEDLEQIRALLPR